jgi:hypothetical protein
VVYTLQEEDTAPVPDDIAPSSYRAALASNKAADLREAIRSELQTLQHDRRCWRFVPYPPRGTPILHCHFVFKKKKHFGQVVRYKVRLVVDGSGQRQGVNYSETFAPVVKYATFRVFCAIGALHGLSIHQQLDVKNTSIYAPLEEEVYMLTKKCMLHQVWFALTVWFKTGTSQLEWPPP